MPDMGATMAELTPLPDEEVLARVVAGDIGAFELLMRRHNQRLYRVARSVVRDDLEAEDIVQEAYVRAYAHRSRFEGRSSVATWLTRIAFHEALRRRRRRLRTLAAMRSLADRRSCATQDAPKDSSMIDSENTSTRLTEALDALPVGPRTVLVLRLVQGLSTRETAACLRLSEANVKVLLYRGKQVLREKLGEGSIGSFREQYIFGAERCDRVVESVFRRLCQSSDHAQSRTPTVCFAPCTDGRRSRPRRNERPQDGGSSASAREYEHFTRRPG